MLKKSLCCALGLALALSFSPVATVSAAPLLAGKVQVAGDMVELVKKKKAKKKVTAGKCGTFMYYSKKTKKCEDARNKK